MLGELKKEKIRGLEVRSLRRQRGILLLVIVILMSLLWLSERRVRQLEYQVGQLVGKVAILSEERDSVRTELSLALQIPYYQYVKKYSDKYDVDPYLIAAVMKQESQFNPRAKSHAGAMGLMQLMPDTYRQVRDRYGIKARNIYDVETNIHVGTAYLAELFKGLGEDVEKVLAWYNGGYPQYKSYPNSVKETKDYVRKVMEFKNELEIASL